MPNTVDDLTTLTNKQIVSAYNTGAELLGKDVESQVKKFRNSEEGLKRLKKMMTDLQNMHGYAVLKETEEGAYMWEIEKPQPQKPSPVEPGREADHRVGATTLDLSKELHLLVTTNPKRNPSRAYDTFQVYFRMISKGPDADTGYLTGENFIDAMIESGFTRKLALSTLHWDIDHGFIRLGKMDEDSIPADAVKDSSDKSQNDTSTDDTGGKEAEA